MIVQRFRLDQLNVKYKSSFYFNGCLCGVKHKIFPTKCKNVATVLMDLLEIIFHASTVPVNLLTKM